MGMSNIDVEVVDLDRGLALVRKVLWELGVAGSTVIRYRHGTEMVVLPVYDQT